VRPGKLERRCIVSGGQDDGAVGLGIILRRGGAALVQDPDDATAPSMPRAAILHASLPAVSVVPAVALGERIAALVLEPVTSPTESDIESARESRDETSRRSGRRSGHSRRARSFDGVRRTTRESGD